MRIKDISRPKVLLMGIFNLTLLTGGLALVIRIGILKNNILENDALLKQVYPGFTPQVIPELKKEINYIKKQLAEACDIFDPLDKSLRGDYDLSIYFVEELSKANRMLKQKAADKQLNPVELSFKEKVPSDKEASSMLNQLYGLKSAVNLGLDYSINFKSIEPGVMENLDILPGIRQQRSQIKTTSPGATLMDFIAGLNEVMPRLSFESFIFSLKGAYFEADITISHIVCDRKVLGILPPAGKDLSAQDTALSPSLKELNSKQQDLSRILKINNPFARKDQAREGPVQQAPPAAQPEEKKEEPVRFFYRGKAILKSQEVAVIEDTLSQETIFVSRGDKVGDFILKDFSADEAVLREAAPGAKEVTIKRAE